MGESYISDIAECVNSIIDSIANKECDYAIQVYKIPERAVEILRDSTHPANRYIRNRVFEHIMRNIGYYDAICDKVKIKAIHDNLDTLLIKPERQVDSMFVPQMFIGVSKALQRIEIICGCDSVDGLFTDDNTFSIGDRSFDVCFDKNPRFDIAANDYENKPFGLDGETYIIPTNGCHIHSISGKFTEPDSVTLGLDKFHSANLDLTKRYYLRYITEIPHHCTLTWLIGGCLICVDGIESRALKINSDKGVIYFYIFKSSNKNYLVIEPDFNLTIEDMERTAFSTLLAYGMIEGNVYLNNSWIAAFDGIEKNTLYGLYFHSLIPSVRCKYSIITTNVYSFLVPVAKKLDQVNGERRALSIIDKFKLNNALPPMRPEVFSKLVDNFQKYESLERGILMILEASNFPLEMQPGIFSIALEAISNLSKQIIPAKNDSIVDPAIWSGKIKPQIDKIIDEVKSDGFINEEQYKSLSTKCDKMNDGFNSDKLSSLLEFYNYPLSKNDRLYINLRNPLLHGAIHIKKMKRDDADNLFHTSLGLHKLCCAIALLMAGYKGYIINNPKLYGFENTCKAFIKIGY